MEPLTPPAVRPHWCIQPLLVVMRPKADCSGHLSSPLQYPEWSLLNVSHVNNLCY